MTRVLPFSARFFAVIVALATVTASGPTAANAQVPVEVLVGTERSTVDAMFFRFFRTADGGNSEWLFFNRNRAAYDHRMTAGTRLPQFGFTEAVSWNPSWLAGFAPVLVGQILSSGAQAKGGVQFALVAREWTVFSWVVSEMSTRPDMDLYALARFTPAIGGEWRIYTQAEVLNVFPTEAALPRSFTQRLRLGLQWRDAAFGVGTDLSQRNGTSPATTRQFGVFVRYAF